MTPDTVPVTTTVLERLERLGLDVAEVFRRAGVTPFAYATLQNPKTTQVTTKEFFAFWRAIEQVGPPDIGLRIGADAEPHQYSVASMVAMHAANLGEGLKKLARYKRLVCPEQITVAVAGGEARVRFEWLLSQEDPPTPLVDGIYANVVTIGRRATGMPLVPRRLELVRRRAHAPMLRSYFGCDIRFDAPADVLVLDEASLATPFRTHNPELLAVVVPGLESALDAARDPEAGARTLADEVRMAVSRRICGEHPAVEKVARGLGMSPRTLQRRLGELGTSYQKLLDDVRHRSARRLLADTDLGSGEVAFLLGFEELNSFTRAFHGWEGTTPTRWRSSLGGRDDARNPG